MVALLKLRRNKAATLRFGLIIFMGYLFYSLIGTPPPKQGPSSSVNDTLPVAYTNYTGFGTIAAKHEVFCGRGSSLPIVAIPVGKRYTHMSPLLRRLTRELNIPSSCIIIVTNIHKPETREAMEKYESEFGVKYWINEKSDPKQTIDEIITRHFFAMFQLVFEEMEASAIIVLEDDLYVSDDFWEYFVKGVEVMKRDPTIFCWSAWNDNGYDATTADDYTFHRGRHFMALGWMFTAENYVKYLKNSDIPYSAIWDTPFRGAMAEHPELDCVYPEMSRTHHTVPKIDGWETYTTSDGMQKDFFETMSLAKRFPSVNYIKERDQVKMAWISAAKFEANLESVIKDKYEEKITTRIQNSKRIKNLPDLFKFSNEVLIFTAGSDETRESFWKRTLEDFFGVFGFGAVEAIVRGEYYDTVQIRFATNLLILVGPESLWINTARSAIFASFRQSPNYEKNMIISEPGESCNQVCAKSNSLDSILRVQSRPAWLEENMEPFCSSQYLAFINRCETLKGICDKCEFDRDSEIYFPLIDPESKACRVGMPRYLRCDGKKKVGRRICLCAV